MSEYRFIKALNREAVDRPPVWLMRQAGRYLPEYRKLRQAAGSFMALCKNPELALEATLQPLARFELDAAILFSDILVVPDVMGCGLEFREGEGPYFHHPIRNEKAIDELDDVDVENQLAYVFSAISHIKKELGQKMPLIGFTGSPWTLASYMVEGGSSRDFATIKQWLYKAPASLGQLLSRITKVVEAYVKAQIKSGIDALMIFDTWGGVLEHHAYLEFSLAYMQRIVSSVAQDVPVILFTKQGGAWLHAMADTGCAGIGLDWTVDIKHALQAVGRRVAVQGNFDPMLLLSSETAIDRAVAQLFKRTGCHAGHIVNLGHGVLPTTPPEHVKAFIDAVHQHGTLSIRDA